MRCGFDEVRVFYTLYHHRIALLAKRTRSMWEYDGRSDPNRVSPEELLEGEVWSHVGRALQLRPGETVAGKPISLNASIASTLVRSLVFLRASSLLFPISLI